MGFYILYIFLKNFLKIYTAAHSQLPVLGEMHEY